MHPLSNSRDISSYFCNFAPICKAPLYAGMFYNLLYQHKKAFRLPINYIFSMVLYYSCAFQCIQLSTGGIFPRTSVNSPLYVRMFGNFLFKHRKAFTLLIKNIFSMVLYSLCVLQCIHFQTGGIFPGSFVTLPLHVRRPYMQGCLVTFCINTRRPLYYR